jgi:hypothetical protein
MKKQKGGYGRYTVDGSVSGVSRNIFNTIQDTMGIIYKGLGVVDSAKLLIRDDMGVPQTRPGAPTSGGGKRTKSEKKKTNPEKKKKTEKKK